jgi:hypothetical protein
MEYKPFIMAVNIQALEHTCKPYFRCVGRI